MLERWGDFGEGSENEAAFVQGGVRECEFGRGDDPMRSVLVGVEKEIEIDDAGALGGNGGAVAAHVVFDGEEAVEEVEGGQTGFEQSGGVEEARLVEIAHGVGGMEAGDGDDASESGEAAKGFTEVVGGRTEGGGKIGAEGDGSGHSEGSGM